MYFHAWFKVWLGWKEDALILVLQSETWLDAGTLDTDISEETVFLSPGKSCDDKRILPRFQDKDLQKQVC